MTLYQIVNSLKTIALSHENINTFGEGNIYDYVDNGGEINYPVSWLMQLSHIYQSNVMTYKFQFIFADLLLEDKSNRLQLQSDQMQVAHDIISKIKLDNTITFNITDTIPFETFEERFDDFAAGVVITFDIVDPYPYDYCSIPTK